MHAGASVPSVEYSCTLCESLGERAYGCGGGGGGSLIIVLLCLKVFYAFSYITRNGDRVSVK